MMGHEGELLKEVETFLEYLDDLKPDVEIFCFHCEEPLNGYIAEIGNEINDRRLAVLEKVWARLYRRKEGEAMQGTNEDAGEERDNRVRAEDNLEERDNRVRAEDNLEKLEGQLKSALGELGGDGKLGEMLELEKGKSNRLDQMLNLEHRKVMALEGIDTTLKQIFELEIKRDSLEK
jgi:hypothetical protein